MPDNLALPSTVENGQKPDGVRAPDLSPERMMQMIFEAQGYVVIGQFERGDVGSIIRNQLRVPDHGLTETVEAAEQSRKFFQDLPLTRGYYPFFYRVVAE
jgi:hypothetical protein